MDLDETRKPASKRPRTEAISPATPQHADATITTLFGALPMSDKQSMESLLAIPVVVVFRTCSSQESQPLLTGGEAECFFRISFLAQEIDTLLGSADSIYLQQRYCSQYTQMVLLSSSSSEPPATQDSGSGIATNDTHPMLRPLLPILKFLDTKSAPTIQNVYLTLRRLSSELLGCSSSLRQSAEQNWLVANTLEAVDPTMSDEKRKVADLEEELCQRIERIVAMSLVEGSANGKSASSARLSQSSQDNQYRRKLFTESDDQNEDVSVDYDGDSQGNKQDQPLEPCDIHGVEGMDQQYALDWKPISEYCSDLFDDVRHRDSSQDETKEGEKVDSGNSNNNDADDRRSVDKSQVEREENENGIAVELAAENESNRTGNSLTENGDIEVDLVNSGIQGSHCNENSVAQEPQEHSGGSVASSEHSNERNRHDEQTSEIDHDAEGNIQDQARADEHPTAGTRDEVHDLPPTQEIDPQANQSCENQGDRLHTRNVQANQHERHPVILPPHITTQPEGSSFPLTAEDDAEEDGDQDVRSLQLMCSQRTSSAAEALAILGNNVSRFPAEDISLY